MNESKDRVACQFDMLNPLTAGVNAAGLARSQHCTCWAAHIPRLRSVDGACIAVRIKSAEASIGKLKLGERIVSDVRGRAALDAGQADANADALVTDSGVCDCRCGRSLSHGRVRT
jgi:hypothetical protein